MGWQAVGLAATIFIRSYNNFGVPAPDLAAAREHAEAVLQEAGLNIVTGDFEQSAVHYLNNRVNVYRPDQVANQSSLQRDGNKQRGSDGSNPLCAAPPNVARGPDETRFCNIRGPVPRSFQCLATAHTLPHVVFEQKAAGRRETCSQICRD